MTFFVFCWAAAKKAEKIFKFNGSYRHQLCVWCDSSLLFLSQLSSINLWVEIIRFCCSREAEIRFSGGDNYAASLFIMQNLGDERNSRRDSFRYQTFFVLAMSCRWRGWFSAEPNWKAQHVIVIAMIPDRDDLRSMLLNRETIAEHA